MGNRNKNDREVILLEDIKIGIIRSNRKTLGIEVTKEGKVLVRAPYFLPLQEIEKIVKKKELWIMKKILEINQQKFDRQQSGTGEPTEERIRFLTAQARNEIPGRVKYFAEQMQVSYGRICIRHQKTRWGSCSSKGNLNFNCMLMAMPKEIQDYVIVHELCHRKEMNHSEEFWKEVEAVLPDYRVRKKWLRDYGNQVN